MSVSIYAKQYIRLLIIVYITCVRKAAIAQPGNTSKARKFFRFVGKEGGANSTLESRPVGGITR